MLLRALGIFTVMACATPALADSVTIYEAPSGSTYDYYERSAPNETTVIVKPDNYGDHLNRTIEQGSQPAPPSNYNSGRWLSDEIHDRFGYKPAH